MRILRQSSGMGVQSCVFLWHFTTNFSIFLRKSRLKSGDGGKLVADVLAEISKHFVSSQLGLLTAAGFY